MQCSPYAAIGKVFPVYAVKSYKGSVFVAPHIHNLATR
jgi:hypothetical protein